jgi:hypothetical protein
MAPSTTYAYLGKSGMPDLDWAHSPDDILMECRCGPEIGRVEIDRRLTPWWLVWLRKQNESRDWSYAGRNGITQ